MATPCGDWDPLCCSCFLVARQSKTLFFKQKVPNTFVLSKTTGNDQSTRNELGTSELAKWYRETFCATVTREHIFSQPRAELLCFEPQPKGGQKTTRCSSKNASRTRRKTSGQQNNPNKIKIMLVGMNDPSQSMINDLGILNWLMDAKPKCQSPQK